MIDKAARIHEPDYDDPKELYAFYGLAAYYAQCFEQSLILLLIVLKAMGVKGIEGATYDEALASLDRETLGNLIRYLKKVVEIGPKLEARMGTLLRTRNYLMHHFFEKNSVKLLSERGRRVMVDDLREIAQAFKDGDHILVAIYEPLFADIGFGRDYFERELEKMKSEDM